MTGYFHRLSFGNPALLDRGRAILHVQHASQAAFHVLRKALIFDPGWSFTPFPSPHPSCQKKTQGQYLRYLTNLGATVLVIHHTGKNPTSKYRGASAMEGAVDLGLKIVGTTDDEGLLTKIEVQTSKTRIGNGKPIVYKMENGIPVRVTATSTDRLMDFLQRNPGLTKEKFEDMARKAGFRRSVVRSFVDRGIVGGTISYEKRKLSVKAKHVRPMAAEVGSGLFADLEDVA